MDLISPAIDIQAPRQLPNEDLMIHLVWSEAIIKYHRIILKLVSLLEKSFRELAIKDPKNYLDKYCSELASLPGTDITKICKAVKDDIGDQIPAHCFTDYVSDKYKNQSQLEKGKMRHQEKLTKEAKVKKITKWLKNQPKDLVDSFYDELESTTEPEIELEKYLQK